MKLKKIKSKDFGSELVSGQQQPISRQHMGSTVLLCPKRTENNGVLVLDDNQEDCPISIFTCASDRKQGRDLVLFASTGECG
jgi:hypothetical protein